MRDRALVLVGGVSLLLAAAILWFNRPRSEPVLVHAGDEIPDEGRVVQVLEAGPHAEGPVPDGLPNVVLVIACTTRRDQTSAYGLDVDTTPFLAELARDGVRFDDAVTAAPWTKASATALLTGHHPSEIGMVEPGGSGNKRILAEDIDTLADRMARAGYTTLGGSANPNLNAVFGFDQGFDRYAQAHKLWREGGRSFRGRFTPRVVDELLRDRPAPERPVYLQLALVDAHAPYAKLEQTFADDRVSKRVNRYRTSLSHLDASLRTVEQTLIEHGMTRENTVWMVVSDHGEGLHHPEHHGKGHGRFLAPSSVGMVWIARGPGIPAGSRVTGLASGVDVPATLLGLVGIEDDAPGIDHSDAVRTGGATERERAWTSTWFADSDRAGVYTPSWMCQVDRKGPSEGFPDACFERTSDPMHARPQKHEGLMAELLLWRSQQEDQVRGITGTDARPSDEVVDQLRELGYVD